MKVRPLIQQLNSLQHQLPQVDSARQQRKQFMKTGKFKCIVCRKVCNYTCPKCHKNYCGIEHFRSHNLFCSEHFHERQVIEGLKGLKVKDKLQKNKVRQMVNNYREQLLDEQFGIQLTIQRLEQLLSQIQNNNQPKLTQKQQYLFEKYLRSLNIETNSNESMQMPQNPQKQENSHQIQVQKPYWQIEDGLSMYLNQQIEIQQYHDSEYPQIIAERQIYSRKYKQFKQMHEGKTKIFKQVVHLHLLQMLYAYMTLFRAFDGEHSQFASILMQTYCSKENQALLTTQQISVQSLITVINIGIVRIQSQFNGQKGQESPLLMWINQYCQFVVQDLHKISRNIFLIIQTLFRIIDCVHEIDSKLQKPIVLQTDNQNKIKDANSRNSMKGSRNDRKTGAMIKKIQKKCEYLINFTTHCYNKQILQNLLCSIEQQNKRTKNQKQITNFNLLNEIKSHSCKKLS